MVDKKNDSPPESYDVGYRDRQLSYNPNSSYYRKNDDSIRNFRDEGYCDSRSLYAQIVCDQLEKIDDTDKIYDFVNYILRVKEALKGNPGVFHNLITKVIEKGDVEGADDLCRFALSKFTSCNLLSDAFNLSKIDAIDEGKEYLDRAMSIKSSWNSGLYKTIIEWFIKYIEDNPLDVNSRQYAKMCESACDEYINLHPSDEAYCLKAKFMQTVNKPENEIINFLLDPIFESLPDKDDYRCHIICPECCKLLLEYLTGRDNYELTMQVAEKAIEHGKAVGIDVDPFEKIYKQAESANEDKNRRRSQ